MKSTELQLLKTKEVRDLAWTIFSPNIITGKYATHNIESGGLGNTSSQIKEWLLKLDESPQVLRDFLNEFRFANRLGKYFELLLLFYFKKCEDYSTVYFSQQVKRNKAETLGEFDFLLQKTKDKKWIHLEVAVKFYLAQENKEDNLTLFIGPNAKDRLDLKLKKLYKSQLQLSALPESKSILGELQIKEVTKELIVKGYVFIPLHNALDIHRLSSLSKLVPKGWWCYFKEYPFQLNKQKEFVVLEKLEWLSPFVGEDNRVFSSLEIKAKIEKKILKLPVLLAEVEYHYNLWKEINHGFLVGDFWPDL